jgi:acyl-CoA synthetase (AMP-forming)/AMP-acid ligase II/acyl carrier protein
MSISALPRAVGASPAATPGSELVDWRIDTLVDLLRRRAAEKPDLILYTYLEDGETRERSITAAELDAAARRIGQTLGRLASPGARVILLFEDGLDYVSGLFGSLAAGLVAVSGVHPAAPRSAERLLGIVRDCGASIVLGQSHVLGEFQRALDASLDALDLRWVASDRVRAPAAGARTATPCPSNGDLALLQYTSGSSREPRGVMLSHRNILHNLHGQVTAFGYRSGDTGVSWLPFSHDMGLIGCVLMAIYGGNRCVLLSPSHFLEDPLRWLRAISRYRASLSAAPNFAFELCTRRAASASLEQLDLSCWSVAVSGAEPIRAADMRRFAATFAPAGFRAQALHPSYGLAEATLLVTTGARLAPFRSLLLHRTALQANLVKPLPPGAPAAAELVDCGGPLADQRLAIVDPATGRPVEAGAIGEIWIAGPSVAAGYFGRADDNAAYFAADLKDGHGPYYRTGDLGFLLDGALFVTGRLRDLLIVRGKNYYPQDFEASAEASHAAIRSGCTACFLLEDGGDLVVVAELNRMAAADEAPAASAAMRDAIIRDHGVNPRRIVLAAAGSALKTPSGKIQRALTRAAYLEGRVAIVHESVVAVAPAAAAQAREPLDPARVEAWFLTKMRAMGVEVNALDPAMRLTELGFDSLRIVELKTELEQDLGIAVNIADLYAFQDIKSLADHLRTEVRRQRSAQPAAGGAPAAAPAASPALAAAPVGASAPAGSRNRLAEQRQRRGARTPDAGGPTSL